MVTERTSSARDRPSDGIVHLLLNKLKYLYQGDASFSSYVDGDQIIFTAMYDYNDEDAVTKHDSIICELSDPDCLDIALCWMEDILLSMDKC